PHRLGAVADSHGVNFAVFSAHATRIELCLFDAAGTERRLDLPARSGDVWHGHVAGLGPGQRYGYRAHGPWAPAEGHQFNPAKLLADPYAALIDGRFSWHPDQAGAAQDGSPNTGDSAAVVPRSVVAPAAGGERRGPWPHRPATDLVIYEAHLRGLTLLHPEVPADLRGTFDALAHPAVIGHLVQLGVTALELLPVQAFADDRHVVERGLTNYWGYQPVGFFAPHADYLGPS